jgi:2-keto-4-pentenoate hydratase/2-oxohepta-3-ene-1,7-dioic acid hydratase in catechol pathway
VPEGEGLEPGDVVSIRMDQIGELANPAAIVQ